MNMYDMRYIYEIYMRYMYEIYMRYMWYIYIYIYMIIYDNMIYFMMANDISRERNNIFRSNEMISRERNNIHFSHRCPLRGSVPRRQDYPRSLFGNTTPETWYPYGSLCWIYHVTFSWVVRSVLVEAYTICTLCIFYCNSRQTLINYLSPAPSH